ncbi:MAG: hypothetical protein PHD82_11640 [Candidatus Riflebacteria bacterium]|nr:hypothetical protein [Candidatus Riflebacteria bacterium]
MNLEIQRFSKLSEFTANKLLPVLLLLFILLPINLCTAEELASFTAEALFDSMEKRSENITAMAGRVVMQNSADSKEVTLSIKSPDKFSIIFADGSVKVFFNGQKLWIYVVAINEVFYHFSDSSGFVASYFSWFNPKKLFTNLTRKTLFSFFNIEPVGSEAQAGGERLYHLKFNPKMESVFRRVFDIGYYEMVFTSRNYLPVSVTEFDQKGEPRGFLKVLEYRLNEEIADECFDFQVPDDAVMVPVSVVLAHKLEEYATAVMGRLGEVAENMKNRILNWSF